MQPALSSPAIFAHRGASAYAPENTIAAFRHALQSHADGIELDVHLSADQHVVVIHDGDVARTTNGQGKVHRLNLEELRRLDAGQGELIPTLAEVLELVGNDKHINIELKGFSTNPSVLPEKTTALVKAHHLGEKIIYSSFNPILLIKTRRLDQSAKLGLLMLPGSFGTAVRLIFTPFVRPWSLHPHFSSVTSNFIQRSRNRGQAVLAWTVNQEEEMRRLFSIDIHGIITDDPLLAFEVRNSL